MQNGNVIPHQINSRQHRLDSSSPRTVQSDIWTHQHEEPEVQLRIDKLEQFEKNFSTVLKTMGDSIKRNEERVAYSEQRDSIKREWQQVALVVDRLLLFIFVLLTIGVTLGLLLRGTIAYTLSYRKPVQIP